MTLDTIPEQPHWAILIQDAYWTEGYESQDRGFSTPYWRYQPFDSKEALEAFILKHNQQKLTSQFKVLEVIPRKIKISIAVEI